LSFSLFEVISTIQLLVVAHIETKSMILATVGPVDIVHKYSISVESRHAVALSLLFANSGLRKMMLPLSIPVEEKRTEFLLIPASDEDE
jgi:hypothetical protein